MKNFPQQLPHSSGVPMFLDVQRLLLAFQRSVGNDDLMRLLKELDLFLEEEIQENAIPGERINHTDRRFWVYSRRPIDEERYLKIEEAAQRLGLEFISPVYSLAREPGNVTTARPGSRRNILAPLPNVILVKQNEQTGPSEASSFAAAAAVDGREPAIQEVQEKTRYLNGYHYYLINNVKEINAYEIKRRLTESQRPLALDLQFEAMPLLVPAAAISEPQAGPAAGGAPAVAPNDPLFPQQWDMVRIQAGGAGTTAWDISTGAATVVTCVLDEGCDLTHPDLQARFSTNGINLGTMMPDGSPTGNHGTACAGIVAATYANAVGVSGVAGTSSLMPVAFQNWTDVEVANGLNWATANGARVISMSFGWDAWNHAVIDPAIQNAFNNNVVMCVATHNYNGAITYPATNPLVIAVGASDEVDNRKSPTSPDGEYWWGSDFGAEISVVAPGVHIPTTDRQGANGYNTSGGAAGDYFLTFNGTSSATPHVAGLAALLLSVYPTLTNVQVRNIIERTAEKVGTTPYADVPGYPNGTWNQEMGYGRINAFRALDFADVMIKDAGSDSGTEPFTGADFWDFSDIVVRITDDNVFVPSDPAKSKNVERGQANYIYVRVTNNGPRDARNVTVSTRITPYVGLQFVYPQDWTLVDGMHVNPTPLVASFATVPAGGTVMAKFRIEAAQTDTLYGWEFSNPWHPCLLAVVNADNDYAFATAPLTGDPISARRNNLAQRNLSVIDVLSSAAVAFPFIMGSRYKADRVMALRIDRTRLPKDMPLLLSLDDDGSAFPLVDFTETPTHTHEDKGEGCAENRMVFLDRTRIKTQLGCCHGVLTLEKGSRFDCAKSNRLGKVTVQGGDVILRGDKRYVDIKEPVVVIQMEKDPNTIYPLSLQTTIPAATESGQSYMIDVAQQDAQGVTVGGAGVVYQVK